VKVEQGKKKKKKKEEERKKKKNRKIKNERGLEKPIVTF
jgi:hypothetical protein